jgi:hypothetical protein
MAKSELPLHIFQSYAIQSSITRRPASGRSVDRIIGRPRLAQPARLDPSLYRGRFASVKVLATGSMTACAREPLPQVAPNRQPQMPGIAPGNADCQCQHMLKLMPLYAKRYQTKVVLPSAA